MYDVDKFLENIEKEKPEVQLKLAKDCLHRFQQSFHPHEAYKLFYDYFIASHEDTK
jgi:hypothetical protein